MTLYGLDILDLAQPVGSVKEKKPRKQANPKRKAEAAQEVEPDPDHEADLPDICKKTGVEPSAKPVKEKKPRTEKQIAAFAKAQETRRLKKEAIDKEIAEKQAELVAKEAEIAAKEAEIKAKKEAAAEKRRLKRIATLAEAAGEPVPQTPIMKSEGKVDPVATLAKHGADVDLFNEKRPAKKRRVSPNENDLEPPKWFKALIQSTERERAEVNPEERKPKKQIAKEAGALASARWNDGLTRDRVQEEVNNHMKRLVDVTQKPVYTRRMR